MATRKPDSEVGPLGVWAYDTARLLELSPEQVAQRAKVSPITIRKIEGGSNRKPSRRLVYEIHRYFREVAAEQHVAITDPPEGWADSPTRPDAGVVPAAYLERLDRYADLVDRLVRQNEALMAGRGIILRDGSLPLEDATADAEEIEREAERAGIGSRSPRRSPVRERVEAQPSGARSGG